MTKEARSFSIDEDLDELLSERDDINASAVVNNFLREYIAGGRGKEAALETRISQLDEEIADLKKTVTRKERERDRLEKQLSSERESLHGAVDDVVGMIERNEFPEENLSAENVAIQKRAQEAGVQAERLVNEVEAKL